jgi:rubredoxin---NAD+ reductase
MELIMKTWMCVVCGLIYEEEKGWPEDGIPAGTAWEDVPADWKCPECGAGKADFEMVEF